MIGFHDTREANMLSLSTLYMLYTQDGTPPEDLRKLARPRDAEFVIPGNNARYKVEKSWNHAPSTTVYLWSIHSIERPTT